MAKAAAKGGSLVKRLSQENYDKLLEALSDIRRDVELLNRMKVGDEYFDIEWFLGGDWKFLACVCGLGAAIFQPTHVFGANALLYDQYNATKEWSLSDTSKGARSIKENSRNVKARIRREKFQKIEMARPNWPRELAHKLTKNTN
ncbi:Hypothetical predicted protein, partial [Paramuricea clavata]